ncbi:hypothetical protein KEJ47_09260 [Candidatus Bathyarchaeota archaeon]|nr:hypothetical protein [Candidatus Bathyarchaeota archaeon]
MLSLKTLRDKRGLSPIFAVLILIAITVIAAIVVYMYSSGYLASMMGWGTTGQEKVAVQAIEVSSSTGLSLTVSNSGPNQVKIVSVIIRDSNGNAYTSVTGLSSTINSNAVAKIDVTLTKALTSGTYSAAVVTDQGNQFVSGSFKYG